MGFIKYVDGDLITLSKLGSFDVIVHGCNCFCTMGAGIAPQMVEAFGCDLFEKELTQYTDYDEWGYAFAVQTTNKGDINKLGTIDWEHKYLWFDHPNAKDGLAYPMNHKPKNQANVKDIFVVNAYTQYGYGVNRKFGPPFDYEAFTLCMRKMNKIFEGKHIGMPKIGAGLAGGDWKKIEQIIENELQFCEVTVVNYKK